ncbi:MAG: hypothetical protein GF383_15720 [Candidatus Lokiarchaeota archaeon]|nr:hypothetical protein [Candidatus Lokiarchaeota archaeon]MBD3343035.1 hypothetical protein [Candidatus Lokiarchaeota archaeon]
MSWRYNYYTPSEPIKVKGGIKAKSKRGDIGDTWWSQRWVAALEGFGWGNRLQRGKRYARSGQVIECNLNKGVVHAKVQGSVKTPYRVTIELNEFQKKQWTKIINKMSRKAIFTAKLLTGEMPPNIEELFNEIKIDLFPTSKKDLKTHCTCPDSANPCKHIAAVHYILAEEFDLDPFMIFTLRGKTQKEIINELRKMRKDSVKDQSPEEIVPSTPENASSDNKLISSQPHPLTVDDFWEGSLSESFFLKIKPPTFNYAVLKRIGPPPFWDIDEDFLETFKPYYKKTSLIAYKWLYGEYNVGEGVNEEYTTSKELINQKVSNEESEMELQTRFEAETGKNAIWGGKRTKGYLKWKKDRRANS